MKLTVNFILSEYALINTKEGLAEKIRNLCSKLMDHIE